MRVLILYTELAGYVLGNLRRFKERHPEAELMVIHYPINPEAPFNLNSINGTTFSVYSEKDAEQIGKMVLDFKPNIVLCSGWGNKKYIEWTKRLDKNVKKVICFDNQWKGTFKQHLLSLFSSFVFLKMFRYAWVPGEPQKIYAKKLGFKEKNIFTGLYPADSELFIPIGRRKLENKGVYPKIMLSVARYIQQKDLPTLWNAFIAANSKTGNRWILNCIGFGELFEQRTENPNIKHLGFKQPGEMEPYLLEAGIYVLPSIYEPWGVAVHEMALSALPLVLSDKVGAACMFLNEENGYEFPAGNAKALEEVLIGIMNRSDAELWNMAESSFRSGLKLQSDNWADTLETIYRDSK